MLFLLMLLLLLVAMLQMPATKSCIHVWQPYASLMLLSRQVPGCTTSMQLSLQDCCNHSASVWVGVHGAHVKVSTWPGASRGCAHRSAGKLGWPCCGGRPTSRHGGQTISCHSTMWLLDKRTLHGCSSIACLSTRLPVLLVSAPHHSCTTADCQYTAGTGAVWLCPGARFYICKAGGMGQRLHQLWPVQTAGFTMRHTMQAPGVGLPAAFEIMH